MMNNRLQAKPRETIRLGSFTPSVLLDVARREGRLEEVRLEVVETPVPSSPAQFASLAAGELDAVFTSPDNAIAYRFLAENPLGRLLDVEIVHAIDRGLGLCLALRPGLDAVRPGLRLAVDVPTSGFAFVGYALLERAGLGRDDYELLTLGSTPRRAEALLAGDCDATVLNAGNELRAAARGASLVASATELGPYLGTVLARLEEGPAREAVDRLAAALLATARDILDGRLAAAAARSAEAVLGLAPELAARHVEVLRDRGTGLVADGLVDPESLATLVALRARALPAPGLDALPLAELVRAGRLAGQA